MLAFDPNVVKVLLHKPKFTLLVMTTLPRAVPCLPCLACLALPCPLPKVPDEKVPSRRVLLRRCHRGCQPLHLGPRHVPRCKVGPGNSGVPPVSEFLSAFVEYRRDRYDLPCVRGKKERGGWSVFVMSRCFCWAWLGFRFGSGFPCLVFLFSFCFAALLCWLCRK